MPQSPPPGWYADPHGHPVYRWWDGQVWTAHTTDGQPAAPTAAPIIQGFYGGTVTAQQALPAQQTRPAQQAQFQGTPRSSQGQRNQYALITFGIVVLYALIAWKAHVYVLGVLPVAMSLRSKSRGEPLAIAAIVAAAVAVVIAVLGFTGH